MGKESDVDELLTTEDVARRLRLSPDTLVTWRSTREADLPYVKLGKAVRYRPEDVRAFVDSRLQAAHE